MPKRSTLADSLTAKEKEFVNRAKGPHAISPTDEEILEKEGFLMRRSLRRRMTKASMERKLSRERPWTKQDIHNQAVEEWLDRNGY